MTTIPVSARPSWTASKPARVFIGHDSREQRAYDVCLHSLRTRSTLPLDIQPLDQRALRLAGLYRRAPEPGTWIDDQDGKPFSTAFSFTRFLIPALCQWRGWALFMDCDMLVRADLRDLWSLRDPRYAVMCVGHDHQPAAPSKMDGREQQPYRRKNWSSFMLWNCEHPSNRRLTPDKVSQNAGGWLHGFGWLKDDEVGTLPHTWNWLEGGECRECNSVPIEDICVVHYTRGGPWFDHWQHVALGKLWLDEEQRMGAG